MANTQVPVKFLVPTVPEGEEAIDTSGGVLTEMCPKCYLLVPTDRVQVHVETTCAMRDRQPPDLPGPPPTVEHH